MLASLNQHAIMRIDGDLGAESFGSVSWLLAGQPSGLTSTVEVEWGGVAPVGFGEPHDVKLLEDGRVSVLDNVGGRGLVFDLWKDGEDLRASVEAWSAEHERCGPQGTMTVLPGGAVWVGCTEGPLIEYAPDGAENGRITTSCGESPTPWTRLTPLEAW